MKTILAPIDLSAATAPVVAAAANLARALDGKVVLLTVTVPVMVMSDLLDSQVNAAAITQENSREAARQLGEIAAQLRGNFSRVEEICLVGQPATLILQQAQDLPADFIVMGSHGHSAFYDLVVGSTTGGVVKKAACPVVIVPAQRSTAAAGVTPELPELAPGAAPP